MVKDPLAGTTKAIIERSEAANLLTEFFDLSQVFGNIGKNPEFSNQVSTAYDILNRAGAIEGIKQVIADSRILKN